MGSASNMFQCLTLHLGNNRKISVKMVIPAQNYAFPYFTNSNTEQIIIINEPLLKHKTTSPRHPCVCKGIELYRRNQKQK